MIKGPSYKTKIELDLWGLILYMLRYKLTVWIQNYAIHFILYEFLPGIKHYEFVFTNLQSMIETA